MQSIDGNTIMKSLTFISSTPLTLSTTPKVQNKTAFLTSSHPTTTRRRTKLSMTAKQPTSQQQKQQRDIIYVNTPSRRYPIIFDDSVLALPETFSQFIAGDKVLIVTNSTVAPLYLSSLESALSQLPVTVSTVILPDGEEYKDIACLSRIWDGCMEARLDRKSTLIALGGGVIGDITGFAASTFVRGIQFIQVPTTLLSVVDSSVGGKTAINHPNGKNMIGAFYQPVSVIVDSHTLKTLDDRQYSSGVSEVIKYGIIKDWVFFEWIEENIEKLMSRNDVDVLKYAMKKSCECKADIVAEDETESGVRAILNLGHTFGHAIEAGMGYGSWLHGEAVATGMVMACEMSARLGWIDRETVERIERLIVRAKLPIRPPPSMTLEKFMTYMSVDKKVESGVLRLILLKEPGRAVITSQFEESILFDTIMHYHQLFNDNPGDYENANMHLPK